MFLLIFQCIYSPRPLKFLKIKIIRSVFHSLSVSRLFIYTILTQELQKKMMRIVLFGFYRATITIKSLT